MAVRPAVPADHAVIADVVTRAFGDDGTTVAGLVDALRASGHVRAELVAETDEGCGTVVAGHVMLSRSWVDARRALVEVLVLSPLSVAPELHGRGLGTELLGAAVAAARGLGAPALFLEGDPGFYSRRGFEPATPRGFLRPSARIPEPAFQVVVLDAHEAWMTGALVYCDPLWASDCVGLRDPLLGRLESS
jgi:putative acetyltransferase